LIRIPFVSTLEWLMKQPLLLVPVLLLLAATARPAEPLSGRWLMTADFFGAIRYSKLELNQQADGITGTYNGIKLQGKLAGSQLTLSGKSDSGETATLDGTLEQSVFSGTAHLTDPADPTALTFSFKAIPAPPIQHATPQRHEFTPTVFYRQYSPFNKPVLTIAPGDTVHTTTVDAGGADEHGVRRVAGGNPQTGPFYVQGAMPGDVLTVHINRLKLNRDWAGSDDSLVRSALNPDLAIKTRDNGKGIRWHLDLAHNTATPEPPSEHLKDFSVPLQPMLGCIATAPNPGGAPPPTGDSGFYGGNMDFNEIGDGATVYLPVSNPGALLYLGDAHALQGDGELNGNALETSMDVEFTVDVIPGKRLPSPRVVTADTIIAMGYSGSLDDAFREATGNMADWLIADYKLTPSEVAQVLGVLSQYKVAEVADRNSGVALKISKSRLASLTKTN
jgi:amidase